MAACMILDRYLRWPGEHAQHQFACFGCDQRDICRLAHGRALPGEVPDALDDAAGTLGLVGDLGAGFGQRLRRERAACLPPQQAACIGAHARQGLIDLVRKIAREFPQHRKPRQMLHLFLILPHSGLGFLARLQRLAQLPGAPVNLVLHTHSVDDPGGKDRENPQQPGPETARQRFGCHETQPGVGTHAHLLIKIVNRAVVGRHGPAHPACAFRHRQQSPGGRLGECRIGLARDGNRPVGVQLCGGRAVESLFLSRRKHAEICHAQLTAFRELLQQAGSYDACIRVAASHGVDDGCHRQSHEAHRLEV